MKPLTISVIVPSYNRFDALRQTLCDLAAQARPADEVLVIDQSQDGDGRSLPRGDQLPPVPGLRYLYQPVPNAQAARNRGIREARGQVLLFVDDDVRLPPDFVASHLRNYEEDPGLDGVAGQTLDVGQAPTAEFPPAYSWPHNGWMFFPLNFAERRATVNWPSCNASVRRELALRIGGFDEQFVRTWFDDTDFSWRLHQAGARIVFDPTASLVHLKVPSGGKRPAGLNTLVLADTENWGTRFYFWRKNFGLLPVWRHVRLHVRGMICRKVLLVRPHWLLVAVWHLLAGYRWASHRLQQGPLYLAPSPNGSLLSDTPAPVDPHAHRSPTLELPS
jgi:GT2 family glycosyltransferase